MELLHGELARTYDLYLSDPVQLTRINHIKGLMLKKQRELLYESRMLSETYLQGEATSIFHLAQKRKTGSAQPSKNLRSTAVQ